MSVATPALPVRTERLWAALLAATLMNLPLGSVYAFSVLLRPIEQELDIPRSALSLVFGLCTVGFTVGSVGAAFLYRAAPAPVREQMPGLLEAPRAQIRPQQCRLHQIDLRPAAAHAFPVGQHRHDQVDGRSMIAALERGEGARRRGYGGAGRIAAGFHQRLDALDPLLQRSVIARCGEGERHMPIGE